MLHIVLSLKYIDLTTNAISRGRIFLRISSVCGVMVSIVAFQAIDPGSTPGGRKFINLTQFSCFDFFLMVNHPQYVDIHIIATFKILTDFNEVS